MISWLLGFAELDGSASLHWTSPAWVIGAAAAVAGVAWLVALFTGSGERARLRLRVGELVAWFAALALLVVALAGPTLVHRL